MQNYFLTLHPHNTAAATSCSCFFSGVVAGIPCLSFSVLAQAGTVFFTVSYPGSNCRAQIKRETATVRICNTGSKTEPATSHRLTTGDLNTTTTDNRHATREA